MDEPEVDHDLGWAEAGAEPGADAAAATAHRDPDGKVPDDSFRGLGRRLEPYAVLAQQLPQDSHELRKRLTDIEKCKDLFSAEVRIALFADMKVVTLHIV